MYWEHDYSGLPGPPDPNSDSTRIFSSPVRGGRPSPLRRRRGRQPRFGRLRRRRQPGHGRAGVGVPDRRGHRRTGARRQLRQRVVVGHRAAPIGDWWCSGRRDCDFSGTAPYADSVVALARDATARLAWQFHRRRTRTRATTTSVPRANAGVTAGGRTSFLGEGSKNGTYYSLDPATGRVRWSTNVVFGGSSGGFIGTHRLRRVGASTGRRRSATSCRVEARPQRPSATRRTLATRRRRTRPTTPSTPRPERSSGRHERRRLVLCRPRSPAA